MRWTRCRRSRAAAQRTRKEIINEPANRTMTRPPPTIQWNRSGRKAKSTSIMQEEHWKESLGVTGNVQPWRRIPGCLTCCYSSEYRCPLDYFSLQIEEEEERGTENGENPVDVEWLGIVGAAPYAELFSDLLPGIVSYRWRTLRRRAANLKHLPSVLFNHLCHPPPPTPLQRVTACSSSTTLSCVLLSPHYIWM